ncbi:restriction endonuclease subunit S [Moraxella atlantae]|uniref:Type I restriction enzyme EcoKI specificity protein n=1 Tax=Faucicola atlantae TaxID=34059 RepID=A0A378Q4L4_9GAMM|nr:restriction endonuclease subunit S [Moraxella atlantae]OPH34269.1 hypothetical protein B5J92_08050 [Moraxella atlantae]STY95128.1 Type I restriction enzyme EcoKI specificity protein [Moraxella atlantae]
MNDLKSGWEVTTLGNIAEYVNGRAFKPTEWLTEGKPIIRIQNLNNPNANFNFYDGNIEEKYHVKNGDLLYSWSASLDSYIWNGADAFLNQHIFNVKPFANISKKFIFYLLKQISSDILAKTHGMGMVHITKGKFEEIEIPIPPINEQNRIVEKIETLFSEIDAGVESLSKAKTQLERYRQSLLKHAFEGKLTAQWRADYESKNGKPLPTADELIEQIQTARQAHYDKQIKDWELAVKAWENNGKNGKKPTKPTKLDEIRLIENLSNLPLTWKNFYLDDLSEISGGLTKNSKRHTFAEQVPYLRVANVYANELRLDEISQIGIQESEKPRTLLQKDDLLIVEGNGSIEQIGRVAIWNDEISPCYHQNHLIKSRAYNYANPKFILYFLMSPLGRKRIVEVASSTAGLHTLSLSKVSNLILPLTTLEEQNQVIEILDEKLSEVEKSVSEISIQLEKAKLLKSAILHKAFQGKLAPQDPTDPPASQLLDQIKAERLAKQTAQTATKSKAKANKQPKAKSKAKTKES